MKPVSAAARRRKIAERAYLIAESRGFVGGDPVEDWLRAEQEVDAALAVGAPKQTLEERLSAANARLQDFRRRLTELSEEAREQWAAEVEIMARQRDRFRRKIRDAGQRSGQAAEKARTQAEKLWDEIATTIERLGKRRRPGRGR